MGECLCGNLCQVLDVGSAVPQQAAATTVGQVDTTFPVCSDFSGPDATFAFTAPYDGLFAFDTFDSDWVNVKTVIQIVTGTCEYFGCNTNYGMNGTASLTMKIPGGQKVLVTVDTPYSPGEVRLNIRDVSAGCQNCGQAASEVTPQLPLCPESEGLYTALIDCVCEGPCTDVCGGICDGAPATDECGNCLSDPAGCGNLVISCTNEL